MRSCLLLLWIVLVNQQLVRAQHTADCKQWLLEYQQSLNRAGAKGKNRLVYAHMTVTTVPARNSPYAQASLPANDLEVKMIVGDRYLVYESPYLAVYRDEKESFTVVHPNKTIIRTLLPTNEATYKVGLEKLMMGRSQFVEQAVVQACQPASVQGKNVVVITLKAGEDVRKRYAVDRIVYYADQQANRILKQEVEYVPGAAYERQTIVFHDYNPQYGHKKLPSADYVLAGNRLRDKYRQYTLEKN